MRPLAGWAGAMVPCFQDGLMTALAPAPCRDCAPPHILAIEQQRRTPSVTINPAFAAPQRDLGMPDPISHPELFVGVRRRRFFAYLIDAFCIGAILVMTWLLFVMLTVLSFGLLAPGLWFVFGLIPLAYHTLLVSGPRAATLGMRAFDLQLRSWDGERPMFLQALAHAVLFYLTVGATCFLILLFALFNRRKRPLHDLLSGMLIIPHPAAIAPPTPEPRRPRGLSETAPEPGRPRALRPHPPV